MFNLNLNLARHTILIYNNYNKYEVQVDQVDQKRAKSLINELMTISIMR